MQAPSAASRVVYYASLDGLGQVRLDLDSCPRRFPLYHFDPEDYDVPELDQVLSITIYLTHEGRWVEHIEELDPSQSPSGTLESFQEVSPAYVAQKLCLQCRDLPPDLATLEPYREVMQEKGPRLLYDPRSMIKRDSQPKRESELRIVYFHPLDDMGLMRLDLDSCTRHIKVPQPVSGMFHTLLKNLDDRPLRFRVLHLTSDGRWIKHTKFDIRGLWFDTFDEIEPEEAAEILWERSGCLPAELESYRHTFEGTRPPSRERAPEAPAELPNLVTLDQDQAADCKPEKEEQPAPTLDPLDEIALADALMSKDYTLEAAFVRHFKDRQTTTWQEIVEAVCPGADREWATIKTWVTRVKNALADVAPRCRLAFRTSQREYKVIKKTLPE